MHFKMKQKHNFEGFSTRNYATVVPLILTYKRSKTLSDFNIIHAKH